MPASIENAAGGRRSRLSARFLARMLYYLAILSGLVLLYGRGDFSTAGFIYQAF